MRDADRVSVKPMSRTLERSDALCARFGSCHFAFPSRMRTRKIARLRRRSDSPPIAPRHAATAAAKFSLDQDRWSEPCKLKR